MRAQLSDGFVIAEARGIGGDLKEHAAGSAKVDGMEILAIHDGRDMVAVLSQGL